MYVESEKLLNRRAKEEKRKIRIVHRCVRCLYMYLDRPDMRSFFFFLIKTY